MSIRVMTHVWQHSRAQGRALLLLLAIADHAADDGTNAYPSIKTLARRTRQSDRNVQYLLDQLVTLGELEVHAGAGPHGTHRYRVLLADPQVSTGGANLAPTQTVRGAGNRSGGRKAVAPGADNASAGCNDLHPIRPLTVLSDPSSIRPADVKKGDDEDDRRAAALADILLPLTLLRKFDGTSAKPHLLYHLHRADPEQAEHRRFMLGITDDEWATLLAWGEHHGTQDLHL